MRKRKDHDITNKFRAHHIPCSVTYTLMLCYTLKVLSLTTQWNIVAHWYEYIPTAKPISSGFRPPSGDPFDRLLHRLRPMPLYTPMHEQIYHSIIGDNRTEIKLYSVQPFTEFNV